MKDLQEICAACGHPRGKHAAYGGDCPEIVDGQHVAWLCPSGFVSAAAAVPDEEKKA